MSEIRNCPGCGSPVKSGQKFCGVCGTKLFEEKTIYAPMRCPNCSSPISMGQKYCGTCGTMLMENFSGLPVAGRENLNENVTLKEKGYIASPIVPDAESQKKRVKTGFISFSDVLFMILGWLVLIVGGFGSIAIIIISLMGGGIKLLFSDLSIMGLPATIIGICGLIFSIIAALSFFIISRLCSVINGLTSQK